MMNNLYFNPSINALNVAEIEISDTFLDTARDLFKQNILPLLKDLKFKSDAFSFYVEQPPKEWKSDIRWISANDEGTFEFMEELFRKEKIAEKTQAIFDVEVKKQMQVYSPFFVVRGKCTRPFFHEDYLNPSGQNAFTIMIPLYDYSENSDGHLLYKDVEGKTQQYKYTLGKGVTFGEGFFHATETCDFPPIGFICFTYGTDYMKHWPAIKQTASYQGMMYKNPKENYCYVNGKD